VSNSLLRYYYHINNPDALSDIEWAMRVRELEWIREKEAEQNK